MKKIRIALTKGRLEKDTVACWKSWDMTAAVSLTKAGS
jgi:ATP phosphoribosyltransferase